MCSRALIMLKAIPLLRFPQSPRASGSCLPTKKILVRRRRGLNPQNRGRSWRIISPLGLTKCPTSPYQKAGDRGQDRTGGGVLQARCLTNLATRSLVPIGTRMICVPTMDTRMRSAVDSHRHFPLDMWGNQTKMGSSRKLSPISQQ